MQINNVLLRKDSAYNSFLTRGYPDIFSCEEIENDKIKAGVLKCKTVTF